MTVQISARAGRLRSATISTAAPTLEPDLDRILRENLITAVYQPIVDIATGRIVAYEALARGPAGTALAAPDALFDEAGARGRLRELDAACRSAAIIGAHLGKLPSSMPVFINVEPAGLRATDIDAAGPGWNGTGGLRLVVEMTERHLTRQPAELLNAVAAMRARGWGIALDDVGTDTNSVALMPLIDPDVIKLDLRVIQERPTAHMTAQLAAVLAHAERTGATILAEGIETTGHVDIAISLGATYGQGWLFGRPAPMVGPHPDATQSVFSRAPASVSVTPVETVFAKRSVRVSTKGHLIGFSRHLEDIAQTLEWPVVLATFQDVRFFTAGPRRRYAALAERASLVAAMGAGIGPVPAPGVRGCTFDVADPLAGQWNVVVLGSHFSGALIARDLGDDGEDADRRFEYVITFDRDLVIEAAQSLAARILPTV